MELPNKKYDVLINEYNYVCTSINEFINEQFKVLNTGIIVFSAVFIYGLSSSSDEAKMIIVFIPIAILALMNYLLYRLQRNNILQGYRVHLEGEINTILGGTAKSTIFYGSLAQKYLLKNNLLSIIQFFYYATMYIASGLLGGSAIAEYCKNNTCFYKLSGETFQCLFYIMAFLLLALSIYILKSRVIPANKLVDQYKNGLKNQHSSEFDNSSRND